MNQEIKKKWIAALESGEYKKGMAVLRRNDNFCCLGVLCDLYNPQLWDRRNDEGGLLLFLDRFGVLPDDVAKWAEVDKEYSQSRLISLNDNSESFAPVVEYIKERL